MRERFALLLSSIEKEWETIAKIAKKIISREVALKKGDAQPSPEETVFIAYQMHNLYGALEEIFKQIARTFENSLEDSARFHAGLLKKMATDIYKMRPRFLSDETFRVLDEARKFRHLFRHAYEYELDSGKVTELAALLAKNWTNVEEDKKKFMEFLIEQIDRK
ncbi:MAG: hypothetical protein A2W19_13490 [Spirochaetes bacterium RBG_16_49_21]|nr:MAG: hypothetical protein A2W19_13490 [Spirochaetes bacterium RBG_16_49_21]